MARNKQLKTFTGMTHVRDDYKNTGLSDTEFAKLVSKRTGVEYTMAEIRQYRLALSIPNNKAKDERDEQIKELKELCTLMMTDLINAHGDVAQLPKDTVALYDQLVENAK